MAKSRKPAPFWIIVADHDQKLFSKHGPMVDDGPINKLVTQYYAAGRHLQIIGSPEGSAESVTKLAQATAPGYEEVDSVFKAPGHTRT